MSQNKKNQPSPVSTESDAQPESRKAGQAAIYGILTGERARKQASDANADDKRCDAEWALGVEWTLRMMS